MKSRLAWAQVLTILTVVAVYFISGKLGLALAIVNPSATAVWPPTGIAVAFFLILGPRVWPAIFLGAFLVNVTTTGFVPSSVGIALGNMLEGWIGSALVTRFAEGHRAFFRPQNIFKFALLAGILSTMVSATLGVTSLSLSGHAPWSHFGSIWLTWWLGDAVGAMLVAPPLILWWQTPSPRWSTKRLAEAGLLLLSVVAIGFIVFGGLLPFDQKNFPLEYLCVLPLVWAAFRFTQREAATAALFISVLAIWGTLNGFGPFVHASPNVSLLLLQVFMGILAVMTVALAAVIHEREQAKQASAQLAAIVQSSNEAIFSTRLDGTITSWNLGAERLYGYSAEQAVGKRHDALVPPDRIREMNDTLEKIKRAEPVGTFETIRIDRQGQPLYVSATFSPIRDSEGRLVGISSISRDISAQKRVERLKDEFVSTVSHELRTPLAAILGSLKLIDGGVGGDLPAQTRSLIDMACRNSERLSRLISEILDFSKIASGQMALRLEPLDLSALVVHALRANQALEPKYQVRLVLSHDLPGVKVKADSDRLVQVLTNLISNAAKFSPPQGTVSVSILRRGDSVFVSVTDRGPGVPKEFVGRIFQKFAQADSLDDRRKGGTGLGLAIVKELVERMGGHVGFESTPNVATTFFFELPEWKTAQGVESKEWSADRVSKAP